MGEVVALGELPQVVGFALAGAQVIAADTVAQVHSGWQALPDTVAVVILTEAAADALGPLRVAVNAPLTVVLPE